MSEREKDNKNASLLEQARKLAKRALNAAADRIGVGGPAEPGQSAEPTDASGAGIGHPLTPLTTAVSSPSMPPLSDLVPAPSPEMKGPPGPQEPFGILDFEEPPETYGIDEVTVLARDPYTLFAYWEITKAGRAAATAQLGGDGALVLRIYSVTGKPEGDTKAETHDIDLNWEHGRRYFQAPRPGAYVTAAIGLVGPGGFAPIAHSPRIRVPFADLGPEGPVEWMEVAPPKPRPEAPLPPQIVARGPDRLMPGAPKGKIPGVPGGVPGWREGVFEHFAGSFVPARPGEQPAGRPPRWQEMPSSPWRWLPGSWPTSGTWPPAGPAEDKHAVAGKEPDQSRGQAAQTPTGEKR